jgi:hypothetical protein|tara:strand:+ start:566 stop:1072 length:507 start_codon:yes stop_codon:yes gene_type:complete
MIKIFFSLLIIIFVASCSSMPDARKVPVNADERVKQNMEKGKGLRFTTSLTNDPGGGNFSFASSNPLWRASLEKLNFMPLNNVDYAGGVIITDWYNDIDSNEEIKIALTFLTNEIRSDALDVTIYKKVCNEKLNCKTSKIVNNLNNEIKSSILKRAAELKKENEEKKN